jgi:predicted NBD/HSP70 family sugar kinase
MSYVAIDLGGTNTRVAISETLDEPKFERQLNRVNVHDYDSDLGFVIESIRELSSGSRVHAIGIGVPGRVNEDRTLMVGSNNLPSWRNQDFRTRIAHEFSCNVYIENDGIAAAIGEAIYGKVLTPFHYLIWGTGISAVSVDRVKYGRAFATYLRQQLHDFFEDWERECSGSGILKKYGRSAKVLSTDEWEDVMRRFNLYLKQFIGLSGASRIIIGGGIANIHAQTLLGSSSRLEVPLSMSSFDNDGGLVGALALIKNTQPS